MKVELEKVTTQVLRDLEDLAEYHEDQARRLRVHIRALKGRWESGSTPVAALVPVAATEEAPQDELISTAKAARLLWCSEDTVIRMYREGKLKGLQMRAGGAIRIWKSSVFALRGELPSATPQLVEAIRILPAERNANPLALPRPKDSTSR